MGDIVLPDPGLYYNLALAFLVLSIICLLVFFMLIKFKKKVLMNGIPLLLIISIIASISFYTYAKLVEKDNERMREEFYGHFESEYFLRISPMNDSDYSIIFPANEHMDLYNASIIGNASCSIVETPHGVGLKIEGKGNLDFLCIDVSNDLSMEGESFYDYYIFLSTVNNTIRIHFIFEFEGSDYEGAYMFRGLLKEGWNEYQFR